MALEYLKEHSEDLDAYDGVCGELADNIIHWLGEDRVSILYVAASDILWAECGMPWFYHMVPIIDELVHDAWHPELVLPPREYARRAFPGQDVRISFYGGKEDGEEIEC